MEKTDDKLQKEDGRNIYRSPANNLFDKFVKHKDVTLVYGEPVKHDRKTVVPVAKIKYSFGGGGGYEKNDASEEKAAIGEGGGGHFSVNPVGVYEIGEDRVRFKPTIDVKSILTILSVLTLGMTLFLRKK